MCICRGRSKRPRESLCILGRQNFIKFILAAPSDKKSGLKNDLSDNEDETTDSQKTSKFSEIFSTTIPSVDLATESWDSSGVDTGYGSQGAVGLRWAS